MKIYTKRGDAGETSLFGGTSTQKDDVRVEAYGSVDELNAALGWAAIAESPSRREWLTRIQIQLFDLGAELATPERPGGNRNRRIAENDVTALEQEIDRVEADLPPLRRFILPGGGELAARLHIARTVARRAERRIVALHGQEPVRPVVLRYMNRLSDLLFVWAREANAASGIEDVMYRE